MILTLFNTIFDGILNLLYNTFDRLGGPQLISAGTFLVRKAFTFCCCTLIAIQIFFVAYYFLIPNMQQELTLHFQKDIHNHYLGYYFNQEHKEHICQSLIEKQANLNNNAINIDQDNQQDTTTYPKQEQDQDKNYESKQRSSQGKGSTNDLDNSLLQQKRLSYQQIDSDLKTLCSIHIHNQRQEIFFERESYQMDLRLVLFDLKSKGFSQGTIPIEIIIIDRNGDNLQMSKVLHFNQNQKKRNLLERIITSFGIEMEDNLYEIEQILFEKLPNTLIDLQAIIIKVQDVGIFIQSSQLVINPILRGLRYYLYYWFYSTSIAMILAIAVYLFLAYYIYYCIKPCILECCKKRSKHHYD